MTDLQKFDPSALMEGVRQRIKATFVSLIPEDHWEQLCQKEVDNFFKEKDRNSRNDCYYESEFQGVCKQVLNEIAREKIQNFLSTYDSTVWENGNIKASDNLKEMIIKMAPEIFAATFSNMFQHAVQLMRR